MNSVMIRGRMKAARIATLHQRWRKSRVKKQGGRCARCRRSFTDRLPPTLDHIVPLRDGGADHFENTQALCWPCHCAKDNPRGEQP